MAETGNGTWDGRIDRVRERALGKIERLEGMDADENAAMIAEELAGQALANGNGNGHDEAEDEPKARRPVFLCPEAARIGPWRAVSDALGYWDTRVWLAVTAVLSARAGRDLSAIYHGDFYGMGFWLLVAPSSSGKALVPLLFRKLVYPGFRIRGSVESGQALVNIVADIVRNDKRVVIDVQPRDAALVLSEWSTIIINTDFASSSLMQRLNQIYDGEAVLDIVRADKNGQGNLTVNNPTLTILGTTTESDFQHYVKERHIQSGLINRHFILPGPEMRWEYDSPHQYVDYAALEAIQATLPAKMTWGGRVAIRDLYEAEALEYDRAWGQEFFDPIHNPTGEISEHDLAPFRRLQVYCRRIAALSAWADRRPLINLDDVGAAHAMVRLSCEYLSHLTEAKPVDMTPSATMGYEIENKVIKRVKREPGITKEALVQGLKKNGGYKMISMAVESLIVSGALTMKKDGKIKKLYPNGE